MCEAELPNVEPLQRLTQGGASPVRRVGAVLRESMTNLAEVEKLAGPPANAAKCAR